MFILGPLVFYLYSPSAINSALQFSGVIWPSRFGLTVQFVSLWSKVFLPLFSIYLLNGHHNIVIEIWNFFFEVEIEWMVAKGERDGQGDGDGEVISVVASGNDFLAKLKTKDGIWKTYASGILVMEMLRELRSSKVMNNGGRLAEYSRASL